MVLISVVVMIVSLVDFWGVLMMLLLMVLVILVLKNVLMKFVLVVIISVMCGVRVWVEMDVVMVFVELWKLLV